MRRIGVDVGGTNTDAVLIEDEQISAAVKTPTTGDVTEGIVTALERLVPRLGGAGELDAVMIGTTHFTNAVVQRRGLSRVAAVRIGLPASRSLEPFVDWPPDLARMVRGGVYLVPGGHEYDGRSIVPFDRTAMHRAACRIRDAGVDAVGITSVFSPLTPECEAAAAEILRAVCPEVPVTLSHRLGRIGLLARENATLLNACLTTLARKTTRAFEDALARSGVNAPLFLTQNDGTVARADIAEAYPVYSFASGPTNSMRGGAFLSEIDDAIVVDAGGTTTDVGCLRAGFPREANNIVVIGGVRTLFRMPDLLSLGLGGGTVIDPDALTIGPPSVGYRITEEALVFGGGSLTATDVAVASDLIALGDRGRVAHLPPNVVRRCRQRMAEMIIDAVDRIKTDAAPLPLVAVGGAAFLVPRSLPGISEVLHVEHGSVANAVGAAIAQVSGEIDRVFSDVDRATAVREATAEAERRAVDAGAAPEALSVVDLEDLPLAYLPGNARRVRVRVVGDTRPASKTGNV